MKQNTHRNIKMLKLAAAIHRPIPYCVGTLHLLWETAGQVAPQGDIGKYPTEWIEATLCWDGKRGALVEALLICGWLDLDARGVPIIHDWHEHCEQYVKARLERSHLPFLSIQTDAGKMRTQHIRDAYVVRTTACRAVPRRATPSRAAPSRERDFMPPGSTPDAAAAPHTTPPEMGQQHSSPDPPAPTRITPEDIERARREHDALKRAVPKLARAKAMP